MVERTRRVVSENTASVLLSDLINRAIDTTIDTNSAKVLAADLVLDLSPEAQAALLQKAIKAQVAKRIRATTRRAIAKAEAEAEADETYRGQLHAIEWTDRLLSREFALADGTYVTWGEATPDQHRERVAMYERLNEASRAGRDRHFQAVREIGKRKAANLYEVAADIDQERSER